ncbi:LLM class flavin-dependent oxidoreductase [Variovorax sp. YR752]|uniref:LLM class flavin-dependent oxidoreductase n=1 Tax=Variovorax sp. YR752 TaxID=1884383 RepID=UPI003137D9A0
MKLSVLDQSVALEGQGEDAAIRDTLALAEQAEALGYSRFWLSEHHGMPTIVGTAPEVLMAAVAARTRRIRIGSAGVMLPHYSALKVAEQFRVLEALAPGRIDLGVGRAPGSDMRFAQALNPLAHGAAEHFPEQVRDLQAWTSQPSHRGLSAHPLGAHAPELWILGSSDYGAQLAAHFGLPYAFAYFFMDGQGVERALELYRSLYRPSERHPRPQATVCVWALAADSAKEACHHALSREHWRMERQRGRLAALQDPDLVAAQGLRAEDQPALEAMRAKAFVGDPAEVATRLRALAAALELDELVINTWAWHPGVRQRSYALLAREFALEARAA